MKFRITLLAILFLPQYIFSQDSSAIKFDKYINAETISRHLHVLASDSLEGRETSKPGMQKAIAYVSSQFKAMGMQPGNNGSWLQKVPLIMQSASTIDIVAGNKLLEAGVDYYSTQMPLELNLNASEMIFSGFGIVDSVSGWNDYANINIENKVVLILGGEPVDKNGMSLINATAEGSSWKKELRKKIDIAKAKNPSAIFVINNEFDASSERIKRWVAQGRLTLDEKQESTVVPVIYINRAVADVILDRASTSLKKLESKSVKSGKSIAGKFNIATQISCTAQKISCNNVLGFIEGTAHKEEVIVISAHLDHLGKRGDKIYYGADDDGSGSATIINIAEAFMKAKEAGNGPQRSILFINFTGEEKGLLGSEYYTNNPVYPLINTVANLNIDMIGRVDTVSRGTKLYTYIIGSDKLSTDLHKINENANSFCCNLILDYKYNDPSDKMRLYYRSDHYNFAKNNVPVIFYFTGLHEDYHEPTDTVDKIDFEKTAAIGRLVFNTAWQIANRGERIKNDAVNNFK